MVDIEREVELGGPIIPGCVDTPDTLLAARRISRCRLGDRVR
jgi:hypothetical protein